MFKSDCIFCKIIQKTISSKIIKENDYAIVIEDIAPKAPIHYLVIPKKHIKNLNDFTDQDEKTMWEMLKIAQEVSFELQKNLKLKEPFAFNLLANNESAAGQIVFHMHWHFISGKNLRIDGKSL